MFKFAKLSNFVFETSDLHTLGMAVEQRNKRMIAELNSKDQEPYVFGIGRHFDNVGYLSRNAADKVMKNGQAN